MCVQDPTGKPIEAMMFDMQTMRYCSPMHDLVVLLANSVTQDVRKPNFEIILRTYHDTLVEVLKAGLEGNVPDCYK